MLVATIAVRLASSPSAWSRACLSRSLHERDGFPHLWRAPHSPNISLHRVAGISIEVSTRGSCCHFLPGMSHPSPPQPPGPCNVLRVSGSLHACAVGFLLASRGRRLRVAAHLAALRSQSSGTAVHMCLLSGLTGDDCLCPGMLGRGVGSPAPFLCAAPHFRFVATSTHQI